MTNTQHTPGRMTVGEKKSAERLATAIKAAERDTLKAQVAELVKALQSIVEDLDGFCLFDMCDGADVPFVNMKTCRICSSIQIARAAINKVKQG